MSTQRAYLRIRGKVQGVCYRANAQRSARDNKLTGWVRNLPDDSVECVVEGPRDAIDQFVLWANRGPVAARVDSVEVSWSDPTGEFTRFECRK